MITTNKLVPAGRGLAPVLLKRATTVELDWDVRQKSRFDATDSARRALGVFLPRGTVVRGGDVLVAEDGSLVRVQAAAQAVMVIRHCPHHGSPFDLTRAAYHLGNRHVAIELQPDHLKIEPDHVLREMLDRMHLIVTEEMAPFEPEGGAYAAHDHGHGHGHAHGHAHGHSHGHEHGHSQGHERGHERSHEHGHEHGQSQGHEHGHGESHAHHGSGHDHAHDHGHDRKHDHKHSPDHAHGPGHGLAATDPAAQDRDSGHRHGPGCGHDHGH